MMNPINQAPFPPTGPPPWAPPLPPFPPPSNAFWNSDNVRNRLTELHDTLNLAKAMQKELEMLIRKNERKECSDGVGENGCSDASVDKFSKFVEDNRIDLEYQESFALEAANDLIAKLRVQLEPFRVLKDDTSRWEEKSAAVRLANKMQKYKRNKLWRKRKRRCIFEKLAKEREEFDRIDKEADEWRAREIAKDIAKRKVEKMKEIAKTKAKEERKRLESELEMILIVEKLQELRSLRIQKLKKQGHFLPEEDDKFLERVRAAVEEEERQAIAAADTDAAKGAIATAEESRKSLQSHGLSVEEQQNNRVEERENKDDSGENMNKTDAVVDNESAKHEARVSGSGSTYDWAANLPMEFYHYYYGSNTDMGTLIEVRRTWDAYIRPGGSRIPGHWVQPPPPADEIWSSYLVKRK